MLKTGATKIFELKEDAKIALRALAQEGEPGPITPAGIAAMENAIREIRQEISDENSSKSA